MVASCTRIHGCTCAPHGHTYIRTYMDTHRFSQETNFTASSWRDILCSCCGMQRVRDSRSDRIAAYLRTCAETASVHLSMHSL